MGFSKVWASKGLKPKSAKDLSGWKKKMPEKTEVRKIGGFNKNQAGGEGQ